MKDRKDVEATVKAECIYLEKYFSRQNLNYKEVAAICCTYLCSLLVEVGFANTEIDQIFERIKILVREMKNDNTDKN